jgi:hypothetical protein
VRRAGELALDRSAAPWSIGPEDWFGEVERRDPRLRHARRPHLHATEEDLGRLFEALDHLEGCGGERFG